MKKARSSEFILLNEDTNDLKGPRRCPGNGLLVSDSHTPQRSCPRDAAGPDHRSRSTAWRAGWGELAHMTGTTLSLVGDVARGSEKQKDKFTWTNQQFPKKKKKKLGLVKIPKSQIGSEVQLSHLTCMYAWLVGWKDSSSGVGHSPSQRYAL